MKVNLEASGYLVTIFKVAETALRHVMINPPSVVLLDVVLPGMDGLEMCKRLRDLAFVAHIPIIFVSASIAEEVRLEAFSAGADDFMAKPFSPRELVARVNSVLRRSKDLGTSELIRFGRMEIDCAAMVLRVDAKEIPTTALEFRLLQYLARSPGLVLSRDRLLKAVWPETKFISPRSVDVYVSKLREKIESNPKNPQFLVTVRGAGYMIIR